MSDPTSAEFFEQCRDAVLNALSGRFADIGGYAHGYGLKITIGTGERTKEHYEAQLIRGRRAGVIELEIGFHSEYSKADRNDAVLARLASSESQWRDQLGEAVEAGPFFGNERWRRVSETWDQFDFREMDCVFEVADRLVEYVDALEPYLQR